MRFGFDLTRVMFSSGNTTERQRVGRLRCRGETVVDLYAGIGYYTLPYLARARAARVHACEWNPDAVAALRHNLAANALPREADAAAAAPGDARAARRRERGAPAATRCTVHEGDNRSAATRAAVRGVADRVSLGLIPSSEPGWPLAAAALRKDAGGWIHLHENVRAEPAARDALVARVCELFAATLLPRAAADERGDGDGGGAWSVACRHVERVKSYAPRVDHVVLDLECRPPLSGE